MKKDGLPKQLIMKNSSDIVRTLRKGKSFFGKLLKISLLYESESNLKVAFLVSRKLGRRAVLRNRTKRYLREIFRQNKEYFPFNCYVLMSVTVPYSTLNHKDLLDDFNKIVTSEAFISFISKILPKDPVGD